MNKRTFEEIKKFSLAVFISMGIVFVWNAYVSPAIFDVVGPSKTENANQDSLSQETKEDFLGPDIEGKIEKDILLNYGARNAENEKLSFKRLYFDTGKMYGSINLKGLLIDDLSFRGYVAQDSNAEGFNFLKPIGSKDTKLVYFEWESDDISSLPGKDSLWSLSKDSDKELVPGKRVSFVWSNGQGQDFVASFEVDDMGMIKSDLQVRNYSSTKISVMPTVIISSAMDEVKLKSSTKHEGILGVFKGKLSEISYNSIKKKGVIKKESLVDLQEKKGENSLDWFALSDKYWFVAAFAPEASSFFMSTKHISSNNIHLFSVKSSLSKSVIKSLDTKTYFRWNLIISPKDIEVLNFYKRNQSLRLFDRMIDFGIFYFVSKPALFFLRWINSFLDSYGMSVAVLTFLFRICIMPLSYYSAVSMSKMAKLRPKLDALKAKYEDKIEYNKAVMRLYSKEGVSPFSSIFPIMLQMPIFLALYKILSVSIELRMSQFLYIADLSAPDSFSNLFQFFGIDISFPRLLDIGLLPILVGLTTYAQQIASKSQSQSIGGIKPEHFAIGISVFLAIIFANMPAGLLVYWISTNIFTVVQQMVFNKILE